ncbi:hypothetical protein DAPPUDRAFT_255345 [Daphnia pulex]|uniref:Uncharacterized protein n=1 Tax=Daphnia pulex TaxID=6669 RepID=E9H902_DAPPU|nr:hypothetical protein DAPPUDRAFT_270547 [Daphnia pulex]EFX71701.1 hypothetical protein DAPPUDRAFT_255345 [Daphnia pulex]|eukprot:EFX62360.1 hypothetical protein DAPPUDRAFT_270547 [Daphnia pulex]
MVSSLMQQLEQQYGKGHSKDGPDVNKQPDKIDVLFDALNDIDYFLSTIGGPTVFLSDIAKHDTTLEFLKPLFTMGKAAGCGRKWRGGSSRRLHPDWLADV